MRQNRQGLMVNIAKLGGKVWTVQGQRHGQAVIAPAAKIRCAIGANMYQQAALLADVTGDQIGTSLQTALAPDPFINSVEFPVTLVDILKGAQSINLPPLGNRRRHDLDDAGFFPAQAIPPVGQAGLDGVEFGEGYKGAVRPAFYYPAAIFFGPMAEGKLQLLTGNPQGLGKAWSLSAIAAAVGGIHPPGPASAVPIAAQLLRRRFLGNTHRLIQGVRPVAEALPLLPSNDMIAKGFWGQIDSVNWTPFIAPRPRQHASGEYNSRKLGGGRKPPQLTAMKGATTLNSEQPRLIILGAGRPFSGCQHSVLRGTNGPRRVLDWLLHAMAPQQPKVYFVGGYQLDEIAERYPQLHYVVNAQWQTTGAAASLLAAPLNSQTVHYVSYADVMFRDTAVARLAAVSEDIAVLVDSRWRHRFEGRQQSDLERCEKVNLKGLKVTRLGRDILPELADAEFAGLVKLQPNVCDYLLEQGQTLPDVLRQGSLIQLLEALRSKGFSVAAVDVAGDWAELNAPEDLSRFILGTKAQTLHRLQKLVSCSRIEDQANFTVAHWRDDAQQVLADVAQRLAGAQRVVVRSSALSEDGFGQSNAGAYTSVLDVEAGSAAAVTAAIDKVIASYPDNELDNQVLVQPMLTSVVAAGVAFTKTLSRGAPYYVINYDDTTSSTESITSGASRDHKTLFLHRQAPADQFSIPAVLAKLLPAIREIESLLDIESLDIEFAVTEGGQVHILQVRPIAVQHELAGEELAAELLRDAVARFREWQIAPPAALGRRAIFGVMPDWNPAEIIGTRPGRLASSLYRYLIMDQVWASQRAEFGYRDLRPQPLLRLFAGHPYVDIRASFNSFVPAALDNALAARLVDFYMDTLEAQPALHDKVEFDVVPTCFGLDFQRWRQRLGGADFSPEEIDSLEKALREITTTAIHRTAADLKAVGRLDARFVGLAASGMPSLEKAMALLEEAHLHGTKVFAHLARSAFVAVTLLKSGVAQGALSAAAMEAFLHSIRTVSHRFTEDATQVATGKLDFADFADRYGHLRPGTYDICSPSYNDDPQLYLRPVVESARNSEQSMSTAPWEQEKTGFFQALKEAGLPADDAMIEDFLRAAIEGREYAKFAFTRHLSLALDCLAAYGEGLGLSRQQLAAIPLEAFSALRNGSLVVVDVRGWLEEQAEQGLRLAEAVALVELPPLLLGEADFYGFLYRDSHANFVGGRRVSAPCQVLEGTMPTSHLAGKIVLIPQADPGFDWLFGHDIGGLITLYGGANSHMAIRAAEFGLPAAIGVGEGLYQRLSTASVLELDPVNKRIQVVR